MKAFPGIVEQTKGKVHRKYLNDEQKAWLVKWFPVTENSRLAKAMGISYTRLHDFAREMGLVKSEKGMESIKKRSRIAAARTNERNGCYDRKRGHPVSEATMAGRKRRWDEERMGLRENAQKRMKRENPERYAEWMRKRSEERKESIRKEKMRVIYNLPRKTKLKAVVMCPFKKSQLHHRRNALLRGYVLDDECAEGTENRYVIFYDKETQRSMKFEDNCIKDGFQIKEWVA